MSTDFFLDAPSPFVLLDAARGHAFLLSVERAPWPAGPLSGTARLDVRVTAQGGSVAALLVRVRGLCGPDGPLPPLELELRVGLVPYDASFSRELLENRYRELYLCLSRNAEAFMTV